jgi:hypothetical protein
MNRLSHSRRDRDLQHTNAVIFEDHGVTGWCRDYRVDRPLLRCSAEQLKDRDAED